MISETFLILIVLVFVLYKYGTRNYNYWKSKGVKQLNPIPFLGDQYIPFISEVDGLESMNYYYKSFKHCGYGGVYLFNKPFLVVADPDLLKQIMVKDSEYFVNRYDWGNVSDPLFSRSLFVLKDESWKKLRSVMSTVFTSSKMKDMFKFMDVCGKQSVEYLESSLEKKISEKKVIDVDLKDFFSRYCTDIIGTTAFGIEVDSFKNPENEFFQAGAVIRKSFQGQLFLRFIIVFMLPKIAKMFNLTMFGKKWNQFFIDMISETIKERELRNIIRKDVIHILMEARKGKGVDENGEVGKVKLPDFTDLDIAAQGVIFFLAGFESTATLLSFACYELAINPDIQEKLCEEIDQVIEKENGITYEGVMHQMNYLNMVLYETLRKWPPALLTDRVVSKSYVIPKTEKYPELRVEKGDTILIPIPGFHYDPQYFPDPQKFDPERFRDEKNTIKPFTFLAFGEGQRHCVGFRYALMEAKCILVHLLKKFKVVPTEKTTIPIKLSKKSAFLIFPEQGFELRIQQRDSFFA